MIAPRGYALFLTILLVWAGRAHAQNPIEVEPADLTRRKDLIDREVIVDDRVKLFWPIPGKGIGEILLKRTTVGVTLPPALRLDSTPTAKSVRVQGILKNDHGRLYIEATKAPELFRSDVERLKKAILTLTPEDAESRSGWGDWAARRADDFGDVELRLMADNLQAESITLELRKPGLRTPEAILALAAKARAKKIAEPEPSALLHLALNLRAAAAKTEAEYQRVADEVAANLPASKSSANSGTKLPLEAYAKDPAGTYREADTTTRAGLDRRLWTDAMAEVYRLRAAADPKDLGKLADEAKSRLPDRRDVFGDLRKRFIEHSTQNVTELREAAMRELVRTYREDLKDPDKAVATLRTWLAYQRKTYLGANNSDQRVELAKKYLELLNDRATAGELAREALKIDESNREAADLFQRMGYVKLNGDWRDPREPASRPATADSEPSEKDDPIIGLTPTEVKTQLGEPKYATRVATQGRVSLQWIYQGAKGSQYIDFLQRAGDAQPVVVGRFSVR